MGDEGRVLLPIDSAAKKACLPEYMCQLISKLVASHNTRNSVNAFQIDRVGSHGVHTFKWNGVKLWNKLPNDVKCAKTKSDFKIQCKRCLMKKW